MPTARLNFINRFFDDSLFIDAFSQMARETLKTFSYDHLLFSFHGLPERHVKKTDQTGSHCLTSENCCDEVGKNNSHCYRAQCFATAKALAKKLGISQEKYTVCFQSRLGRTPWIQPHTDRLYKELAQKGIRRLAVMCPAFVADCLETLEEIQIRGRADFIREGGQDLKLIPSLNSSVPWVDAVAEILRRPL